MATRYGTSAWVEGVPARRRTAFPAFRGTATAPIVIVGAGLTGCMTAYACAAAGRKVVLLDADRVGQGGSGRGAGWFSDEAAESFRQVELDHGRRAARAVFDAAASAPRELAAAVRRLRLRAGVELRPAIRLLPPGGSDKSLRREVADRKSVGLDATWLTPAFVAREVAVSSAGGMRLRAWGIGDPYRLALGFVSAAVSRGAVCYERSRVVGIDFDRRHATVSLEHGEIDAGAVVVCTGTPAGLFKPLQRHFRSVDRYVVQTDVLPAAVRAHLGSRAAVLCDVESPSHSLWFTSDHRAVFAGADQKPVPARIREQTLVQRTGQLMYELTRLYPEISGVAPARGWDVPIAHTVDQVLIAGPHRNYPHHVFALGTSHDPARAFLASRIVLRHLTGTATPDDEHFAFSRVS